MITIYISGKAVEVTLPVYLAMRVTAAGLVC